MDQGPQRLEARAGGQARSLHLGAPPALAGERGQAPCTGVAGVAGGTCEGGVRHHRERAGPLGPGGSQEGVAALPDIHCRVGGRLP
eukprot:7509058-Alexandrium_andersonii.AAC.1